jgi:hypothetical protein
MKPDLAALTALLHADDDALRAQGEELVAALSGGDALAAARVCVAAHDLPLAAKSIRASGVRVDACAARELACDLAEQAVGYVASDVVPKPGRPRRDPRCDEVIAGARGGAG